MKRKKLLVIGSAVCDVIVRIPHLPHSQEDLIVESQQLSLGGCAANVAMCLKALNVPFDFFAPVGSGMYGDFVAEQLQLRGINTRLSRVPEANGCCYCLVEKNGERTFLADHGAEYRFQAQWFSLLNPQDYDGVYICGLELEESGSQALMEHLRKAGYSRIYFACGPRHEHISSDYLRELEFLPCLFHLNEEEAIRYFHNEDFLTGAAALYQKTHQPIVITRGANGCLIQTEETLKLAGLETKVADTIGAGDTHIAALMAACHSGMPWREAGIFANRAAALVVAHAGAQLSTSDSESLKAILKNHGDEANL